MPAKKDIANILVDAALKLATEKSWHDVTIIDIAQTAGVTIADCHAHVGGKADILRRFIARIDHEVLADLHEDDFAEPGHDRLIAVIMARFDALADHREALRSILKSRGDLGPADSMRAIKSHFGSMRWMLEAAGFRTSGLQGSLRVAGLTAIYARTFRHWLDDDSTDFAPTMAYLDRELSKAAGWDGQVEKGLGKATGLCRKLSEKCQQIRSKKSSRRADTQPTDARQ